MVNQNIILNIGVLAKKSSSLLKKISGNKKNLALHKLQDNLKKNTNEILAANSIDIKNAKLNNLSEAIIDRLTLNTDRINQMILSLREIIDLEDPIGKTISEWDRPNGLHIKKISTPIGVIGIIYESRPNVTIDASAIAMKAGNAVILRGGKDSFFSSFKLWQIINTSFEDAKLPKNVIQMISSPDRSLVDEMLKLDKYIDVIIPRGGKNLIQTIKERSSIPIIKHLDGICHIFVDKNADIKKAKEIIFNSKLRRPGVCGAVETLLIDENLIDNINEILDPLIKANCEIRVDESILKLNSHFKKATIIDWSTEYLEKIISVKLVKDIHKAIEHINQYSSGHTEAIITNNKKAFEIFSKDIDSAIILQNASTQFADGGEFGFGAEIGISTDKLHVRGPVGTQHLTSFKYVIHGNGQVRP
ncbi:glutamate-5-semialdehyde dehydrogenase [Alphaproteobacteria bacterium]|nr:glutamate-5-semialdehyde dehydrogenase [Alphaproteobacteria bacterium]